MKKILVLLFFVIFFLPLVSSTFAENIAVIVNENSPAPASLLTAAEIKNIKDIYLGKVKYWNKQVIKPANQREENIFSTFIKKVCEMNLNEYRSYWVRYALETGLSAPQMRETVKDVINYVQANVSAVGYLWESEAKDLKGVKVILVLT